MSEPRTQHDGQWDTFQHWVIYATRDIGGRHIQDNQGYKNMEMYYERKYK